MEFTQERKKQLLIALTVVLALVFVAFGITQTSGYKQYKLESKKLALDNYYYQLMSAHQDRQQIFFENLEKKLAAEKARIRELNVARYQKELDDVDAQLAGAQERLAHAKEWQLLRSHSERAEQIEAAQREVNILETRKKQLIQAINEK